MNKQTRPKAVIWFMAARPCLKLALELLYKNFNNKYKYPVLITTFGRQYGKRYIKNIHKKIDPSIKFIELPKPEIPTHIEEKELFYNRKEIEYVKGRFPKSRIGFLHTNQFITGGIQKLLEMKKYDYVLKMDDDTFIIKPIDFDIFSFMRDGNYKFGPFANKSYDYKNSLDCEIGFREFVKKYIKENNIIPASKTALDKDGNWDNVGILDPTIWDLDIFRNRNWDNWWNYINNSGGIYKYRWGDQEIHILYTRMYYPESAWHNFDFYGQDKCKHGGHGTVHQRSKIKKLIFFIGKKIIKL
ncbi:MAG: hypothetical protein Q8N88_03265 [Nanoarchaeota archaeon]|nr:hypothetical protein [Nanoarchaeota archaeon]